MFSNTLAQLLYWWFMGTSCHPRLVFAGSPPLQWVSFSFGLQCWISKSSSVETTLEITRSTERLNVINKTSVCMCAERVCHWSVVAPGELQWVMVYPQINWPGRHQSKYINCILYCIFGTRNMWHSCLIVHHCMCTETSFNSCWWLGSLEFGETANCILYTWLGWIDSSVAVLRPNNVPDLMA